MYTIGQVARMFRLPSATLRNYDNQGLLPNLQRKDGNRLFSESDLEMLRIIESLRASGMELDEIKAYIELCEKGKSTYAARRALLRERKEAIEEQMEMLQKSLNLLKYEYWYYDTAIRDGNEDGINAMLPDKLPENIQEFYDKSHNEGRR